MDFKTLRNFSKVSDFKDLQDWSIDRETSDIVYLIEIDEAELKCAEDKVDLYNRQVYTMRRIVRERHLRELYGNVGRLNNDIKQKKIYLRQLHHERNRREALAAKIALEDKLPPCYMGIVQGYIFEELRCNTSI